MGAGEQGVDEISRIDQTVSRFEQMRHVVTVARRLTSFPPLTYITHLRRPGILGDIVTQLQAQNLDRVLENRIGSCNSILKDRRVAIPRAYLYTRHLLEYKRAALDQDHGMYA
jgi:hypothetical protein